MEPRYCWSAAVAVLLFSGCSGCASFPPDVDMPPAREVMPALEFPNLRDYRGVFDCRLEGSGLDQQKLAELASEEQVDFVFLADRARSGSPDYGAAGFTEQVLFIPGASFAADASGAEVVGVNLHDPIEPKLTPAALIAAIHSQGGVAIVANPGGFSSTADYGLADGVEISLVDTSNPTAGLYIRAIFERTNRFFAGLDMRPDRALDAYDAIARGANATMVLRHGNGGGFTVVGYEIATFAQLFEIYTTHLIASERTADALVDALKRGHAYVSVDVLGFVAQFAFYAEGAWGRTMMGDSALLDTSTHLKVELPGAADRIAIVADGGEVGSGSGRTFEFVPKAPGAYRVEAYRRGRPWIFSNPVYLRR